MRMLDANDVRRAITDRAALDAVRAGFAALERGEAVDPPNFELAMPNGAGEVHVKGGYLHGARHVAIKMASGFYGNAARGLPVAGGMTLVLDSETGVVCWLVTDGGLLTELRTAAAGALAADLLARQDAHRAVVVGAGGQARHQLRALLEVRPISEVTVVARRPDAAAAYADEVREQHGIPARVGDNLQVAVSTADIVVLTTPARRPLLLPGWLSPGCHVTAMGSDMPDKNEVDPRVLAEVDKLVVDTIESAARSGELHHGIEAGVVRVEDVHAELSSVVTGRLPGRETEEEITLCDLTGLGVQDVAISAVLAARAAELGLGTPLPGGGTGESEGES